MRLVLSSALFCGQLLLSCSNGHENTSKLDSYVGDDKLEATYHAERIYVVSAHPELQTPQLWRNGFLYSMTATTQSGSDKKAWSSTIFQAKTDEIIHITSSIGQEKLSYAFKFVLVGDKLQLQTITLSEAPLPTLHNVPGNQVNVEEFLQAFNRYRAQYGLPAVRYSYRLSAEGARNNQLQRSYGLGHHYLGSASAQNSAVGYGSIQAAMNGWHNSSGHRVNMQRRHWTCMGIHRSGSYWTQNFTAWKDCQ